MKKTLLVITVIIFCIISQNLNAQVTQDWVFRDSINNKWFVDPTFGNYMNTNKTGETYLAACFDSNGTSGYSIQNNWLIVKVSPQGNIVWRNIIGFPVNTGGSSNIIISTLLDQNGNFIVLGQKKY